MNVFEIETPALIIDYDIMKNNSNTMMNCINKSTAELRPHFKSHKCTEFVKFQLERGAKGITCAKLSEAQAIIDSGISCDILIANQIVERSKIKRLAKLCKNNVITVLVDNEINVFDLECALEKEGAKLNVLIEYEIGMERCGVLTESEFYNLVNIIAKCPHLTFKGIQAYAGHISHEVDEQKRVEIIEQNNAKLKSLLSFLKERNVNVEIVSGASTGTAMLKMNQGIYNEIQAGSYLFLDDCYNKLGLKFDNALFVLSSVVSVKDNLAVVDAGVKTVGVDQGLPTVKGVSCSEIVASEEHFQLHNPSERVKLGQKVLLVPGHCCSTMNLHDSVYLVSGQTVVKKVRIDGRGYGK